MVGFLPVSHGWFPTSPAYQGGFSSLVPSKIYYFAFGLEACKFYRFALGLKKQKKPGKQGFFKSVILRWRNTVATFVGVGGFCPIPHFYKRLGPRAFKLTEKSAFQLVSE